MYMIAEVSQYVAVASFAEAWIEISLTQPIFSLFLSPPSRRRGLKLMPHCLGREKQEVASFAEAWIEIFLNPPLFSHHCVASFAEAWIEIVSKRQNRNGLLRVASFAEAWIEIRILAVIAVNSSVASFTEAWIEIGNPHCSSRCCYIVSSQR